MSLIGLAPLFRGFNRVALSDNRGEGGRWAGDLGRSLQRFRPEQTAEGRPPTRMPPPAGKPSPAAAVPAASGLPAAGTILVGGRPRPLGIKRMQPRPGQTGRAGVGLLLQGELAGVFRGQNDPKDGTTGVAADSEKALQERS